MTNTKLQRTELDITYSKLKHIFPLLFRPVRKMAKATISFIICLSVHMGLGSNWTNFHKILYLSIFRNSGEKIQVSLKTDKNKGYFTGRLIYIFLSYLV